MTKGSYEQEVLCRDKAEKYVATVSILLLTGAVIHTNYSNVSMVMFVSVYVSPTGIQLTTTLTDVELDIKGTVYSTEYYAVCLCICVHVYVH